MNVDLEKPVNKLINILFFLLLAIPMMAQVDSLSAAKDDSLAFQAQVPVIEYTMQRKTYEIAEISVT